MRADSLICNCRFTLILTFVVLCVVGLAMIGRIIRQTRSMVVGYM